MCRTRSVWQEPVASPAPRGATRCQRVYASMHSRLQRLAEYGHAVDVTQIDGQAAARVDVHLAEELESAVGRQVRLPRRRRLEEHDLRSERAVERIRPEGAGIERARHEFPEPVEIPECRPGGIVIVRGAIVNVGRQPHHVAHMLALEVAEQLGELELTAFRAAWFSVGDGLPAWRPLRRRAVADVQTERHVGGDHLPDSA